MGSGRGENEEKGTGNKKHKWQVQNRQGEVKNSMGNGELICMTPVSYTHLRAHETYEGVSKRQSADFSKETWQARRGWKEVFKVMKGKDLHPRLLYPAKVSFRMEGQIKCFPDKIKLKEFIITKPL